jgi:hypothetical protein
MFTVKYVAPSGDEVIGEYEAVMSDRTEHDGRPRVLVFNDTPTSAKDNNVGVYVASDPAENEPPRMHSGVVYVMNRYGATVATYRL